MNKLLLAKIALSLAIVAIVITYTVYNLTKTPTSSAPPIVIKAKTDTKAKTGKQQETAKEVVAVQEQTLETHQSIDNEPPTAKKAKPSRFMQDSSKLLENFKSEPVLDAGWAYTQEQVLYNLVTQEIYPNEGIKVADELKVECKSETCMLSTKLESFEQVEKFYDALIHNAQTKGYQFNPVKMSPQETIFAIYPPKP